MKQNSIKRMSTRVLMIILAFCLIASFTACQGNSSETSTSERSTAASQPDSAQGTTGAHSEPVKIYVYNWQLEDLMQPMIDAFKKDNPDIDVQYVKMADPSTATGNLLLASGEPIDVLSQPTTDDMRLRVANGQYEPLSQFLKKDNLDYRELYGDALTEIESVDGEQYSIPNAYNAVGLFFNKKLFDNAGVAYPTDDWTWDDMRAAAKKVATGSGANRIYGLVPYYVYNNTDWLYPAVQELGMNYLFKADGTSNFDNPAFLKSLQLFYDMEMVDKSAWPISEYQSLSLDKNPTPGFWQGRAAMVLVPAFAVQQAGVESFGYKKDFDYGVVNMPKAKAGDDLSTIFYTSDFSIPKSSKNKDAAWKFIKYTCIDHPEYFSITKGVMPAVTFSKLQPDVQEAVKKAVFQLPGFDVESGIKTFITNSTRQVSLRTSVTTAKNEINDIMVTEGLNCLLGNQTPAQALAKMKTDADKAIAKKK